MTQRKPMDPGRRYAQRRRAVVRRAGRDRLPAVMLVTHGPDIRYLSGSTEGANGLLFAADWAVLFTSKMFATRVPQEAPGCAVVVGEPMFAETARILRRRAAGPGLGIQAQRLGWSQYGALREAVGRRRLVDAGEAIAQVRMVKDEEEIGLIRRCVRIAERAYQEVVGQGVRYLLTRTERHLAAELEYRMCLLGADRQGFPVNGSIVASGPNSASCHHFPGSRKPRPGEPLLFDWGAEKHGYRCDITRVVFLGEPSPRMRELYGVVRAANAAGIRAVRAGATCAAVAQAGWSVVQNAGYGDLIRHGLGHGFGLDVHEPPGLGTGGSQPAAAGVRLRRNMVVTIEPGVYLDGKGGIRIEDDVLVTGAAPRVLTTLPTDLQSAILR